jgi:galactose mutarotase-like enzyme
MSSNSSAVGRCVQLGDSAANSRVVVSPERGALVTSFSVGGRELLYMDESTLQDATKNVRGGIPVLFPAPGKLEGDTWRYGTRAGAMKQHGFARNLPWSVVEQSERATTLLLQDSPITLAQFPWPFRAELRIELHAAQLQLTAQITNTGDQAMPYAFGLHPYFAVADKANARIPSGATRAFDNVKKQVVPFTGFDFTQGEVDLHLLDHPQREATLELADGAAITVRGSSDVARWVVWTLAGREFVCLEPWTAPGNALNTREHLIVLSPGDTHRTSVEIEYRAHG